MQKNEMQSRELANCYFIKTVLMILIVFYHCIVFWSSSKWFVVTPDCVSPILARIAQLLNSFHIYAFALVSGYIYYAMRYEQGKYSHFGLFIANKSRRLLIPYISVSILWVIPHNIIWYKPSIQSILKSFLLGVSPDQLWFLLMLFWVFMICYAISNGAKKYAFISFPLVCFLYFLGVKMPTANYFQYKYGLMYVLYFLIGFYIREFDLLTVIRGKKKWLYCGITGFLFVLLFAITRIDFPKNTLMIALYIGLEMLMRVFGSVFAFLLLQVVASHVDVNSRFVVMGSKYSMTVFLLHQQIIQVMLYCVRNWTSPMLISLVCFAVTMAITTALAILINKVKPLRFLFSGKA